MEISQAVFLDNLKQLPFYILIKVYVLCIKGAKIFQYFLEVSAHLMSETLSMVMLKRHRLNHGMINKFRCKNRTERQKITFSPTFLRWFHFYA